MRVKTSSLMKVLLACSLLLSLTSCASVHHAVDDTRFTLKDGVIDDPELGLQWVPAPDRQMNHYQAEEYVRNLSLAGDGWRMPTRAELKSLYDKSKPGGADPKFNVSNMDVWTSELDVNDPSGAWEFDFSAGSEGELYRDHSNVGRVLAVRSLW